MADDVVLSAEKVSKKFCRELRQSMYYGALDVCRSMIGRVSTRRHNLRKGEFWAVNHVDFSLKRGETLGLIGANGSGKSTLLRILNGIYEPDAGKVTIQGRVGALIALGAGFHPLMTGRENIYLNGAILGMTTREIDVKFDDIVNFADVGEFLDAPVKTYSSGMQVRLGFAIAMQSNPDILLVDEVLAVGDAGFQKKCFERVLSMITRGTAMIFVSHSMSTIERLCTSGLLLSHGKQAFWGSARECVQRYFGELGNDNLLANNCPTKIGLGEVTFSGVFVYQEGGAHDNPNIEAGKDFIIQFSYEFVQKISDKNQVRVWIKTFEGRDVQRIFFQESPFIDKRIYPNEIIIPLKKAGTIKIRVRNPRLFPQTFRLDIGIAPLDIDVHLGALADAATFNITHPKNEQMYLEYGNMTVTNFEYDVTVS